MAVQSHHLDIPAIFRESSGASGSGREEIMLQLLTGRRERKLCLLVGYGVKREMDSVLTDGWLHGNSRIVVRLSMFYIKCRKGGLLLKVQVVS